MAIFIVDQFSLNTDLPLDIRYVPDGGSYNDVSSYWYPGMQVYQTSDETIWYADNSLNWHPISEGADASLNLLYQIVNDLSTNVEELDASMGDIFDLTLDLSIRVDAHDASLNDLEQSVFVLESSVVYIQNWNTAQDASIVDLRNWNIAQDSSITTLRGRVDVNETSILYNDSSIIQLFGLIGPEASINDLWDWNIQQDASLVNLTNWDIAQDTSLVNLTNWDIAQDTSLVNLTNWDIAQDTSLVNLTNWDVVQDLSIANLESSLGLYVLKTGDTMTGDLIVTGIDVTNDVSIGGNLAVDGDGLFLGDLAVRGDLVVDGSTTFVHTEVLDISTAFINLNTGLVGPPPSWLQSGIIVERGDASSYGIIFDETDLTFRIGVVNEPDASGVFEDLDTQAVATREDNPIDTGIAVWNDTARRFDTSTGLTYSGTKLTLDGSLVLSSYAGVSVQMLTVGTDGIVRTQDVPDASLNDLYEWQTIVDASIALIETSLGNLSLWNVSQDTSLVNLSLWNETQDTSLVNNSLWNEAQDTSLANNSLWNVAQDTSLANLTAWNIVQDISILANDASIVALFALDASDIQGAINVGDGSAQVFAGVTAENILQFREIVGVGAAVVAENGNVIEISLDASFAGEVNTASNIGTGEGTFAQKVGQDLEFKSIDTNQPTQVIITSDNSTLYVDISVGASAGDASLSGLTDTSINDAALVTHTNIEFDLSLNKWIETQNGWWDTSLATTTDDLGGVPQGTILEGLTLKEVLYKILYEYQPPTLATGTDPLAGTYEKGIPATQFSSIDVSYYATNANYPLALLNNVVITKNGSGSIFDASLGLVDSSAGAYTDGVGITNWGGVNRTISYNITIDDDSTESKPSVGQSQSFTFYYRQFWGEVDGGINPGDVSSGLITTVDSSRLAGETNLTATFDYVSGPKIKYLFAYPDTVAAPDNFGILSQITDQNDFDITSSWDTGNVDVSVGVNNVRYRYYLLKNKVDTPTFDVNFKF